MSRYRRRMRFGLTAAFLIGNLIPLARSAMADFTGASISHRGVYIQLALTDQGEDQELRAIVFDQNGLVPQLAGMLANNAAAIGNRKWDVTIELSRQDQQLIAFPMSTEQRNALVLSAGEGSITFRTADDLTARVCAALSFKNCTSAAASARIVSRSRERPKGPGPALSPAASVNIHIGSLPSSDTGQRLWIPLQEGRKAMEARNPNIERVPIEKAIEDIVLRTFKKSEARPPTAIAAELGPPEFFVVHCTAFGATEERMKQWVKNNIAAGKRYLSHGVVLPSGLYLPMWEFDDRRVWATKTETCAETRSALGKAINVEVHYFCGDNRTDQPTAEQYSRLADIYLEVSGKFGPLRVVSHREVDRGLHDGHGDPYRFQFSRFYTLLKDRGVDIKKINEFTDARHGLPTYRQLSHHWRPRLSGPNTASKPAPTIVSATIDEYRQHRRPECALSPTVRHS